MKVIFFNYIAHRYLEFCRLYENANDFKMVKDRKKPTYLDRKATSVIDNAFANPCDSF